MGGIYLMKILITTDTFYPMINGVVISTNNLYKELKKQGHDVRIMALSDNGEERIEGDIYYLKSLRAGIYPNARFNPPFIGSLAKQLLDWAPDVVHSQTEFSTLIAAKHISNKLEIPHVHTYHTLYEDYLKYLLNGRLITPRANAVITRMLLNSMDAVVVPTKKVEDVLLKYGVQTDTYIIPTGINLSSFKKGLPEEETEKLLESCNLNKDDKVLVYVGRIAEEKNIREVIRYFTKIVKEVNNAKLLIVGGGPYLEVLKSDVKELGIEENVRFSGMVKPTDVYKYYKLGDVFVTASTSETQGLTYIEALATGTPVVCRFDPCVVEVVINGKTGFTYRNEEEFIYSVKRILSNNELRKRMIIHSLEKAEEYSCENFGRKMIDVYSKITRSNRENRIKAFVMHNIIRH